MTRHYLILTSFIVTMISTGCSPLNFVRGGIYKNLDADLTIVSLTENPTRFLNKEIVMSVRFYKLSDLPCPLGDDYVNFIIADRVSYITLNKVWMKKDKAQVLDSLKEMETIVMKARVFKVDKEKDPNLEVFEIVKE
ncbi:MAG: hypothetical protein M0T73_15170 [Deltaproteobacteria bacterium]|nr:hypothetical protein [Deltaproteobacteria bacterium]